MARGKFAEWLEADNILLIQSLARNGLSDEKIAHNMGIAYSTLKIWKDKYPSLFESLKRGKEVIDRQVENALLKRALGYEYEEVKIIVEKDEKGNEKKRQEKVIKKVIPDTTAQIFWLKNRKPADWRDRKETQLSGEIKTKNNPFDELTADELRKLIK